MQGTLIPGTPAKNEGNTMDYRLMYSADWLTAPYLGGKEHTVTIERVEQGEMPPQKGKKGARKPVLYFKDKPLPLAINKTIGRTLAMAFGVETANWIGKEVVLYPTTTDMAGQTVECIRVKIGGAK